MKRTGYSNKPIKPAVVPASTAITADPPGGKIPGLVGSEAGDLPSQGRQEPHWLWKALQVAASLRITVVLFVLSFILIYYGTWAQVDQGIWTVVDKYFRSAFVFIPLHVVLMRAIDPTPFAIPFPGGWLLGGLLLANLLAAHIVRFKVSWKRTGILLIHGGLIIMMLSELITGLFAVEARMVIRQGETVNFVQLDRVPELAIIDPSDPKEDEIISVPLTRLKKNAYLAAEDLDLPFSIEVTDVMVNSELARPGKDNPADTGHGQAIIAQSLPEVSGTDPNQTIDYPSAYLTFYDRKTGDRLGTYLFSYHFLERPRFETPQVIKTGDGKNHQVVLRPKREYRDFSVKLLKFTFDRYPGTQIPKNYQSDVLLLDPERKEKRKISISMNSPLRYRGETFYQASFSKDERGTVLQVVRNPGWLMPYISCIVVTLGMFLHFGLNLFSFLQRRMA